MLLAHLHVPTGFICHIIIFAIPGGKYWKLESSLLMIKFSPFFPNNVVGILARDNCWHVIILGSFYSRLDVTSIIFVVLVIIVDASSMLMIFYFPFT